jgi:transcriptional regulator with XRE-family HTH domain
MLAITPAELAHAASVFHGTISGVERGLVQPRLPTLRRLARALGRSLADLLEPTDLAS